MINKWSECSYSIYSLIKFRLFIENVMSMNTLYVHTFIYVSNLMRFSTKKLSIPKKSAFTIREILVIIVVVSVGLLSVLVVLSDGMKYVQKTRQKVVALNLAREWMEAIYQIRDTNRTRRAWVKDACWLKTNPLVDEWSVGCSDDVRFSSGFYILQRLSTWGQQYFALDAMLTWIDFGSGIYNSWFALCQTWVKNWYWDSCPWRTWNMSEWKYFREIEWRWLYLKDVSVVWWSWIVCSSWSPVCWTSSPKEFRFCSRVVYMGDNTGEVKLCGVITNFKGK